MQNRDGQILVSAGDLIGFLECEHFTALSLQDLVTPLQRAEDGESVVLIQEKGFSHESAYLEQLRAQGLRVVELKNDGNPTELAKLTEETMRAGPDVIFQATFLSGRLLGRADFLKRVERPSKLGAFGYEVQDTKLARSAKAKFVVQLCFYSDLLAKVQGEEPHSMHLVLGDGTEQSFRVANYSRYFRQVRDQFLKFIEGKAAAAATYPQRCAYCQYCPWREICDERWRKDDYLNQVAGITRNQIERLQANGTKTMAALAALEAGVRVPRLQPETVRKLRSQASLQVAFRDTGARKVERLDLDPAGRRGFFRMPKPDEGDVFFDMEGDPLEGEGLEYLFGVRFLEDGKARFDPYWAHSREEEAKAFERFIDLVTARRQRFPAMHIYHYGAYEPSALKRLMSLHGTREAQVDALLRGGVFVDLYKVVREAIRTSQDGYSIKDIEAFYMPARQGEVKDAGASIVHYERWKASKDAAELEKIRSYNDDDCRSTQLLRDWLLAHRPGDIPWYTGEASQEEGEQPVSERTKQIEDGLAKFWAALLGKHPLDRAAWTPEHHFRELVFQLLDFHRRSDKPQWWAMFARQDMTQDELMDDIECLAGLTQERGSVPEPVKRSLVYTFNYPEQETKLRAGKRCKRTDTAEGFGEIVELDEEARRIKIKVAADREVPPVLSVGPEGPVGNDGLREAVWRFGSSVVTADGRFGAVRALLAKEPPKLKGRKPGEPIAADGSRAAALDAALRLDGSYLFVQGPPGAGKTTTGSQLIVGLLKQGKRVGVTSNSHKAVNNLLQAIETEAQKQGFTFSGMKKSTKNDPETPYNGRLIKDCFSNADAMGGTYALIAGTAWLFADPDLERKLDYLFIDEAGQVSLAYLVAMGTSARNIILLGDQMQLGQPVHGVHPGRSGESSLEYLLDDHAAVPEDRGIFLGTTWRMHDDVCRFISDAVYDGRLKPDPKNRNQRLVLAKNYHPAIAPTGIRFIPVQHEGCAQRSEPEGEVVKAILESLLKQHYVTKDGAEKPLTLADVLIVAPYNAQVNHLKGVLPDGARVGTIDKFQGQQAEVVIASMTTSSGDDLTRNIEFLFSKNRLNVAVSRAKCLAIVVASPDLLKVRCNSVGQMELVNTLCWLQQYANAADLRKAS